MKRELDTRTTGEGERVALVWDDESNVVELQVEGRDGLRTVVVPAHAALDALDHPYLYLIDTPAAVEA